MLDNALASVIFLFNMATAELVFSLWVPVVTTVQLIVICLQQYVETIVLPNDIVCCSRLMFHCCVYFE